MIFISKKAFEDKVFQRMNEIDFRTKTDERLYRLEDRVRELSFEIDMLRQAKEPMKGCVPVNEVATNGM